jgi:peptide deformylase
MTVREVLLLGNLTLYEISKPVSARDLTKIAEVVTDLHDTLTAFRERHGAGRAIAAPQIGVMKRLVYMYIHEPMVFINPVLDRKSEEMIQVWDDCLCFPELLVKVRRHKRCLIRYQNMEWGEVETWLEDDISELLQHEIDHLDGILAVSRAIDGHSFALRNQKHFLEKENAHLPGK